MSKTRLKALWIQPDDDPERIVIRVDFRNDYHYAIGFHKGMSLDSVILKLRQLANDLENNPHLQE